MAAVADPRDVVWLFFYRRVRDVVRSKMALGAELGISRQGVQNAFSRSGDMGFGLAHLRRLVATGKMSLSQVFRALHDIAWEIETDRLTDEESDALKNRRAITKPGRPPKLPSKGEAMSSTFVADRAVPALLVAERARKPKKAPRRRR